jgi:hypothetical protein
MALTPIHLSGQAVNVDSSPLTPGAEQKAVIDLLKNLNTICDITTSPNLRVNCLHNVVNICSRLDSGKWPAIPQIKSLAGTFLDTPDCHPGALEKPKASIEEHLRIHYPYDPAKQASGTDRPKIPPVVPTENFNREIVDQISNNLQIALTLPQEQRQDWISAVSGLLETLPQTPWINQMQDQLGIVSSVGCDDLSMNEILIQWNREMIRPKYIAPVYHFPPPAQFVSMEDCEKITLAYLRILLLSNQIANCTDLEKCAALKKQAEILVQEVEVINFPDDYLVTSPSVPDRNLGTVKKEVRAAFELLTTDQVIKPLDSESMLYGEILWRCYFLRISLIEDEKSRVLEELCSLITQEDLINFNWVAPIHAKLKEISLSLEPITPITMDQVGPLMQPAMHLWEKILASISAQTSLINEKEIAIVERYKEMILLQKQFISTQIDQEKILTRACDIMAELFDFDLPFTAIITLPGIAGGQSRTETFLHIKQEMYAIVETFRVQLPPTQTTASVLTDCRPLVHVNIVEQITGILQNASEGSSEGRENWIQMASEMLNALKQRHPSYSTLVLKMVDRIGILQRATYNDEIMASTLELWLSEIKKT